jgi:N-methylhydantoinase A
MARPVRIAVDIGGTFTDLECVDARGGPVRSLKTPTTPDDPSLGLMTAIREAAARFGFALADIGSVLHGTTIATNAVLTRSLPAGALVTTAGFEDVLEIGRHARTDIYRLAPPARLPLVPRRRRFGIGGRIGAGGEEVAPLDRAAIEAVAAQVAASGAETCAVCLLNAFANPAHEIAVTTALRERLPGVAVSPSHEVSPEMREFERTATTVLNALLVPVMARYLDRLTARIAEAGLDAPLWLVQSNGGAIGPAEARRVPVRLLLSGPSGGVLAAERVAVRLGMPDVVGVDMGGTSYDVAVIRGGQRATVAQGEVDGLPVRAPMVDMRTIGAGGGSIVAVDAGGRLTVGPRSAGAVPGPVCYRRGGTEPTITDVNLLLGRLDAGGFMGGAMTLDLDGAAAALAARVAGPLGLDPDRAAAGVLAVLVARLAGAIRLSLFEKGLDPRDFALMSFGGAGGLHAAEVAEELGIARVIFPKDPSTFSAHGILQSDIVHDLAASRLVRLAPGAGAVIADLAAPLVAEGTRRLAADGIAPDARALHLAADLRYRGQAFELMRPLAAVPADDAAVAALAADFHTAHRERFSFDDPAEAVDLVTLRLSAIGRLGGVAPTLAPEATDPAPVRHRPVHLNGAWVETPVWRQEGLPAGTTIAGPAIVEQAYTTLIVPAGWRLTVAASGDMVATREWHA